MKSPGSEVELARAKDQQRYERLDYASELCVILTEKCNIRCRHCINDCSPSKSEDLDLGILESFISQASELEFVHWIAFSGGEPFFDTNRLERAIGYCHEYGLEAAVITNGSWATSVSGAKHILENLAGLSQVCVSTDAFHQEFVSIERVINTIKACSELNYHCTVVVTHLNDPLHEVGQVRRQLQSVSGMYEMQQWPVLRCGRALAEIPAEGFLDYDVSRAVCISADTPTLNTNGELTACCGPAGRWPEGHPLCLGHAGRNSVREMLLAAEHDPMIQALRVVGPAQLLRRALSIAAKRRRPLAAPSTTDMCAICEYIFTDPHRYELAREAFENPAARRELSFLRMAQLGETSMFLRVARNDNGK